jgi:hypothetical protein
MWQELRPGGRGRIQPDAGQLSGPVTSTLVERPDMYGTTGTTTPASVSTPSRVYRGRHPRRSERRPAIVLLSAVGIAVTACTPQTTGAHPGQVTPPATLAPTTPTATPTPTATVTVIPTPTPTTTMTAIPTPTPTTTMTAIPTPTTTVTAIPTTTATPTTTVTAIPAP